MYDIDISYIIQRKINFLISLTLAIVQAFTS